MFAPALTGAIARLGAVATLDPFTVLDRLDRWYRHRPLLYPVPPLGYAGFDTGHLTGGQLAALGHQLAVVLRGLGVGPNTRVLLFRRNHSDYLIHMHAVIAAGGIPVSVNTVTGWSFAVAVAERTRAHLVLTDGTTLATAGAEHRAALSAGGARIALVGGADDAPDDPATVVRLAPLVAAAASTPRLARRRGSADTVIALFHTSGTTGVPKLCAWTGANSRRIWKIMALTLPVGARSRLLMAYPFSHALYFALGTGALLCGAPVHGLDTLDPDVFLATIERLRATGVFAFPHLYMRALASTQFDVRDLDSVRIWATGADKIHAAHISRLIRRGRLRLRPWGPKGSIFLDSYGSTEIGAGGIMQLWGPGSRPQPCVQGRPMPSQFAFRIVDEQWRDVPPGQDGRILVRSTTAFAGYWNDHERWADSRIDGWWWAGDVGRRDERGRLLFLDREADSVRTADGLLRTLPVEERLLAHPDVMEVAVYQAGADRDGLGHPVAVVAPRGAVEPTDLAGVDVERLEAELLGWANRDRSGPPLSRVRVASLADIPFGATGKVLKTRLRERDAGPPNAPTAEQMGVPA